MTMPATLPAGAAPSPTWEWSPFRGIISAIVAQRVFDLPWSIDFRLAAVGALVGVVGIGAAGLLATRRVVNAPPRDTLRALGG